MEMEQQRRKKISNLRQCRFRHGPDRVQCGADPDRRAVGQCGQALGPGLHAAIAEPLLDRVERPVSLGIESATQVARVQQVIGSRFLRGLHQGETHLVRVGIAATRAIMVRVEFTDHRHPGQCHLREDGAGELAIGVGIELGGDGTSDPARSRTFPGRPESPRSARWNAWRVRWRPGSTTPSSRSSSSSGRRRSVRSRSGRRHLESDPRG